MENLTRIIEMMKALACKRFTGYLKISFVRGMISKVEKFEEILKK